MERKGLIIILDGFGCGVPSKFNAVLNANTPFIKYLYQTYPFTQIKTSGLSVGLPEGQMGNSEVGHTNIGAGRVVYQDYTRISRDIEIGEFGKNEVINDLFAKIIKNNSTLHLMGLFSDGGVHSDIYHLEAIIKEACSKGVKNIQIHTLLDGRDTPPQSSPGYFERFEKFLNTFTNVNYHIGMVSGRFYAMDRDKRWDRVSKAYFCLTKGEAEQFSNWKEGLAARFNAGENDEFVTPYKTKDFKAITHNDGMFFFNFRSDRAREISHVFLDDVFTGFERGEKLNLCGYVSMTEYETNLPTQIAFKPADLTDTIGEVISKHGFKQLRIAETEKYAHVTFFFNGGVEAKFEGEDRVLIPSPKEVKTYDLKPQMSIYEVTEALLKEIEKDQYKLIILNFANGDMVGHTGFYDAAIKALEAVDECLSKVIPVANKHNYVSIITADHGNSEEMWDEENNVAHTQHTTNPVPLWVVNANEVKSLKSGGSLRDISPTMLKLLGIEKPKAMDGESLCLEL